MGKKFVNVMLGAGIGYMIYACGYGKGKADGMNLGLQEVMVTLLPGVYICWKKKENTVDAE